MDKAIYSGEFTCLEDVISSYGISAEEVEGIQMIYADYNRADYDGDSIVIFIKNNILYEVNGGHCSCHGLEDCWKPEETSVPALLARNSLSNEAREHLKNVFKNFLSFI